MSTYMPNASNIERKWYIIDAAGKPLGRVAAQAAVLLRGKHKTVFTPHVDCGDHVVIINCGKTVLTGKKLIKKVRYKHTGYIGHLKTISYELLMEKNPEKAMEYAVKGMIPNTTLGRKEMLRLRAFPGENHNHQAQNPKLWENIKEA